MMGIARRKHCQDSRHLKLEDASKGIAGRAAHSERGKTVKLITMTWMITNIVTIYSSCSSIYGKFFFLLSSTILHTPFLVFQFQQAVIWEGGKKRDNLTVVFKYSHVEWEMIDSLRSSSQYVLYAPDINLSNTNSQENAWQRLNWKSSRTPSIDGSIPIYTVIYPILIIVLVIWLNLESSESMVACTTLVAAT